MNKISVIVPVYNVEKYLERCLNSIVNQTYNNLEIILVDDGSTDRSGLICDKYSKKDDRIVVIHKKNEGQSIARNVALEIMTGQYISFVDSDDFLNLRFYEKMINILKENNVKLVTCDYQCFFDEKQIETEKKQEYNIEILSKTESLKELWVQQPKVTNFLWNKLYDKEIFKDIVFPQKRIFEDLAVMYQVVDRCENIAYVNEKLYYYFDRNDSSSKKISTEFFIEKIKIVDKRQKEMLLKHSNLKQTLEDYRFRNNIYMFWTISRNCDKEAFFSEILYKEWENINKYIKGNNIIYALKQLKLKYKFLFILLLFNKKIFYIIGSKIFKY